MQVILCIASILFGGLSLLAAVVCNMVGQQLDSILAFLGCTTVCAAAILNGIKSKQFYIPHHIIRIALSVILIIGFAVL